MQLSKILGVIGLMALFVIPALAEDASEKQAKEWYEQSLVLYKQRADLAQNEKALQLLAMAERNTQNPELKYDILTLESKALYWKGGHTQGDSQKLAIFESGQNKAEAAKKLIDDRAEAYFLAGINLGRWAETNGIISSLFRKNELIGNMEAAIERLDKDGNPGEAYDGYGPYRVLGRVYFKLPGFAGGSHELAIKHLTTAYNNAKNYAVNVNYLAEALNDGDSAEKKKARQILDELLSKDEKTLNPDRIPETQEEFVDARKLRAEMGP